MHSFIYYRVKGQNVGVANALEQSRASCIAVNCKWDMKQKWRSNFLTHVLWMQHVHVRVTPLCWRKVAMAEPWWVLKPALCILDLYPNRDHMHLLGNHIQQVPKLCSSMR